MRRNFSQSIFMTQEKESEADNDPRIGLVNLADVMLVFACGLMLALVSYWNLDVSSMSEVTKGKEMKEVQQMEEFKGNGSGSGGFIEKGIVYQDPMNGKYYMLQKNDKTDNSKGEKSTEDSHKDKSVDNKKGDK